MASRPAHRPAAWTGGGLVTGAQDVRRVLDEVNAAGLRRHTTATAPALPVQTADEAQDANTGAGYTLPVAPELAELMPWDGLRRGATIGAVGSTSLLMTLVAAAMRDGSWAAVVGMPAWGSLAAFEHGVALDRLALIPHPGPDWPTVAAAVIDGCDIVVVAAPPQTSEAVTRALRNRARQRNIVLLTTTPWLGSELTIELVSRRWVGLGQGHGRLRRQDVTLRSHGRGTASRPRTVDAILPLPSISGQHIVDDVSHIWFPPPPGDLLPEPSAPAAGEWRVAMAEPVDPPTDPWGQLASPQNSLTRS